MFLVGFGWKQNIQNKSTKDYFLGNKRLPWFIAMLSIVATETSVLTFISIPGIAYRGNWFFLQLVFGYILGRILVSFFLLPKYFSLGVTSIYEVLGRQYGKNIQKIASGIFLLTRVLADGIRFLATAVIIQVVTGWSLPIAVITIGLVTMIYSILGGIKTIIWIDSFQFVLYLTGGIITLLYIADISSESTGSILLSLTEAGKIDIFNFFSNIFKDPYFFISAVIGGLFLSLSSHGVDYMMVQRVLSTKDLRSAQKAMIGSGFFVMFQFLIFLLVGSFIFHFFEGAVLQKDREFSTFIVEQLPIGFRGLLLAGILSAAMSTLSSSINSLASSTIVDWIGGKASLIMSKFISIVWAVILIGIALIFDESDTAIVIIGLQIASFTYGGLLALFLLTKFKNKFNPLSLILGLLSSLIIVFYLKNLGLAWTWFIAVSVLCNVIITFIAESFFKPNETKMITFLLIIVTASILYNSVLKPYQNTSDNLNKIIRNDIFYKKIKNNDFDKISLNKKKANDVSKYLWTMYSNYIKESRGNEMAEGLIKIDSLKMKFYYKIFGKKPQSGHSLYISLHGGGGTTSKVNDQQWENQKRLYNLQEGIYLVPRAPTNTWDLWHQSHIDTFFNHLIQNAIVNLHVNSNKVYIMGYSAGGDGVYQLAPRMADRFAAAAMMAGHPNETSPAGLRNIGFTIHMGENDKSYDRNKVAVEWGRKLARLQKNDPGGYLHHVEIHPDLGHWMEKKDSVAIPWMSKFIRDPYPKKIIWEQDDVIRKQFYWLGVEKGKERSQVIANIKNQTITIEKSDVSQLIFRLNDTMLDMDKPIVVKYSGNEIFNGIVQRNIETIASSIKRYGDPNLIFYGEIIIGIPNLDKGELYLK